MVRRSKRGAKSDHSEGVTEEDALQSMHSGESEMVHSVDEQNILNDVTSEPLSDPAEKVTKEVVGETEDVQGGQSEKEAVEQKEGVETGEGCMSSGLKDPKARSAEVNEVMDHEVASAIAEAEKALASESEAPPGEHTALPAVEAVIETASEEVVDISDSDEREAERCLYCDDRGFSVNDVDAYVAHLENEHRVVRNALLLARNTIDTHRQGMSAGWGGVLYGPSCLFSSVDQFFLSTQIAFEMPDLKPCPQNLLRRSNCLQWKTLSQRMRMMMSYSPKKWKKRQAWKKTMQSRWRWARLRKRRERQM